MASRWWFLLDLVLVGVFAVIGRLSHYGSLSLEGWWTTAWPFLGGTVMAWVVLLISRRSPATVAAGAIVWMVTLAGGMMLRMASDEGTALPFVVVATLVLAALLALPRVAHYALRRGSQRRTPPA